MIGVEQVGTWVRRRRAVRRRFNPYVVGAPVFDPGLFVGRAASTREVLARLARGNVRVIGEHRIGKTSFLHHLRSLLSLQSASGLDTIPVFVDLESATGADLPEALLEETVDVLAVWSTRGLDQPPAAGLRSAAERIRLCATLLDEVVSRTGRAARLVYLVDEIDMLADERGVCEALDSLTSGLCAEVRFVTAAARPRAGDLGQPGHHRGRFEDVELPPLSVEDGETLVRKPVAGVFDFEDEAVSMILDRSNRRPYLIQKISARALDRMLDDRRTVVRRSDVDAVSNAGPPAERSSLPNASAVNRVEGV